MNPESCRIGDLVLRLQTCFLDNPELPLSPGQAREVCGADETTARAIVDLLVEGGVIARTGDGLYVRRIPPPRSASERRRLSSHPHCRGSRQSTQAG
jgi:hypothetical protein